MTDKPVNNRARAQWLADEEYRVEIQYPSCANVNRLALAQIYATLALCDTHVDTALGVYADGRNTLTNIPGEVSGVDGLWRREMQDWNADDLVKRPPNHDVPSHNDPRWTGGT